MRAATSLADALEGASNVQENSPETLEAKRTVFAELDRLAAPGRHSRLIDVNNRGSRFTETLQGRHRCLVAHPVNPPHLVPLVELVGAPWTAPETIAPSARPIYEFVGQVPIVVRREIDGFILNRLQAVLLSEAFRLDGRGICDAAGSRQDAQGRARFRWSFMGPFETIELNAPGGIPDYCQRYGPSLSRLSAADPAIYQDENLKRILSQWQPLNSDQVVAQMHWRDRRLAGLKAHKRSTAGTEVSVSTK